EAGRNQYGPLGWRQKQPFRGTNVQHPTTGIRQLQPRMAMCARGPAVLNVLDPGINRTRQVGKSGNVASPYLACVCRLPYIHRRHIASTKYPGSLESGLPSRKRMITS